MEKYKCSICGYVYDSSKEKIPFNELDSNYKCCLCGASKQLFVEDISVLEDEDVLEEDFFNCVSISNNNISIERIDTKCINCGMCKDTCLKQCGLKFDKNNEQCINCGQCILTCPTNALIPKNDKDNLLNALTSKKICIAYTSPAVRVSIGEAFGKEKGSFEQKKLVGLLRMLGFDYVLDVTFGADLTIMEEVSELIERIKNKEKLPMLTSCCPAWVKYAETFYPEILENISTCKSPIGMQGIMVKEYFSKKMNLNKEDIYTVAITPCTAKKYEINKKNITGTNLVVTINELIEIVKSKNINYDEIISSDYDNLFQEGSGGGTIFGVTGGVMESSLRTLNYFLTQKQDLEKIEFESVRGYDNIKEATIKIGEQTFNVAVVHKISSAKKILDDVKNGISKYHYIEIMNCEGGCVGGGGQPKYLNEKEELLKARINGLYKKDKQTNIRCAHNNPDIIRIYNEFLEKPLSEKSKQLLHTTYQDKSYLIKK